MAEYIDKAVVRERLVRLFKLQAQTVSVIIDAIPTADVKPVIHGEWVKNKDRVGWHCSVCQKDNVYAYEWNPGADIEYTFQDNYCPNCGADMRG